MKTFNIYLVISIVISQLSIGQAMVSTVSHMTPDRENFTSYDEPETDEEPRTVLDGPVTVAEFAGGKTGLFSFLASKVKYPTKARTNGIQGVVYVQFTILEDGTVDENDIHIVQSVHPDLDKEALRVVREMPQWAPAMEGDEAVQGSYTLPIRFILR